MSYTMYTPLNVWLDPASVTDVVAYIQTYLSENTIYSETEIETIIHDYLISHPELIGGVQSVNGKTGTVVLSASDINTQNNVTIESVLASLSSQISTIAANVATNTANITSLTGRISTAETELTNVKSNIESLQFNQQYINPSLFEQLYYWYNSNGNIVKNYNASGTAYYAYPKLTLNPGTYKLNYVPKNFSFLKDTVTGEIVLLKNAVTNSTFTITNKTEFYYTVYDQNGTIYQTTTLYGFRKIYTVGADKEYKTISSACAEAAHDDIIYVYPGVYTEQISIWGKKLHIIGYDKKLCTIIDHSGEYDTPPIEMNIGTLANLTIIEDNGSPSPNSDGLAYCIHNDYATGTDGEMLDIFNCDMINDIHACIGFGMYANYTVRIRNCTMRSNVVKDSAYKRGALYFHANSSANVTGQTFIVENCIISSADDIAVYAGVPSGGSGEMLVRFLNNAVWSDTNGTFPDAASISENATFVLDPASTGNSISKLNNTVSRQGSRYTLTVNASSSAVVNAKRNKITINGSYHFFVVSEDKTSYDTGVIYWNTDGSLVVEEKNALCNVSFSKANGDLRVWNRDTANNHSYMVMVSPL